MSATHDVESLLSDLATAVHRDHRRRRRHRLLGGLAAAAIVCTDRGRARRELRGLVDGRGTPGEPGTGRPRHRGEHDRAAHAGREPEGDRRHDAQRGARRGRNQGRRLLPDPLAHGPAEHRQLVHQRAGERASHVRVPIRHDTAHECGSCTAV